MKGFSWDSVAEYLFATHANCLCCGSEAGCEVDWLCAECYAKLRPLYGSAQVRQELCIRCGERLNDGVCPICGRSDRKTLSACAAYGYEAPVDALVKKFKFQDMYRLDKWLALEMVKAVKEARFADADVIVPVPLHWIRKRLRGYNQSERLAGIISWKMGIPVSTSLIRTRNTRHQARLSSEERRKNLKNAFCVNESMEGKSVLLIDDVRTTGSTVSECARVLMEAGASKVRVATFAAAGVRRPSEDS